LNNSAGDPRAEFIRYTQAFWGRYAGKAISAEDAREICENVVAFFRILQRRESVKDHGSTGPKLAGKWQRRIGLAAGCAQAGSYRATKKVVLVK
jgi:hypothetical protein